MTSIKNIRQAIGIYFKQYELTISNAIKLLLLHLPLHRCAPQQTAFDKTKHPVAKVS